MASYAIEGASGPDVDIDALPCTCFLFKMYCLTDFLTHFLSNLDVDREIDEESKYNFIINFA
jgi:hypothetical protein